MSTRVRLLCVSHSLLTRGLPHRRVPLDGDDRLGNANALPDHLCFPRAVERNGDPRAVAQLLIHGEERAAGAEVVSRIRTVELTLNHIADRVARLHVHGHVAKVLSLGRNVHNHRRKERPLR